MASIAYVSDENMLEYHRLNGSKTIAFWRFSNKQFSDFASGDLLFFLSKREIKRKEKGIVGYGRYVSTKTMTINSMWNNYQQSTGYINKTEFVRALQKNAKTEQLPDKINCLVLDQVFFFNAPIYLSELGINIHTNLESFTYLDKQDNHVTLQILQKAREIGEDNWSNTFNSEVTFEKTLFKNQLASLLDEIGTSEANKKIISKIKNNYPTAVWINDEVFVDYNMTADVYFVYSCTSKNSKEKFVNLIGKLNYIQLYLKDKKICHYHVVTDNKLTTNQIEVLNRMGVDYLFND